MSTVTKFSGQDLELERRAREAAESSWRTAADEAAMWREQCGNLQQQLRNAERHLVMQKNGAEKIGHLKIYLTVYKSVTNKNRQKWKEHVCIYLQKVQCFTSWLYTLAQNNTK